MDRFSFLTKKKENNLIRTFFIWEKEDETFVNNSGRYNAIINTFRFTSIYFT